MPSYRLRIAVSNTGPLVSAFQSDTSNILKQLYDRIAIPRSSLAELVNHGAEAEIRELLDHGLLTAVTLSEPENIVARKLAQEISRSSLSKQRSFDAHIPEAEAIALMQRSALGAVEILLDERAARAVAQTHQIPIVGFAGMLMRACRRDLMTPESVRLALTQCKEQGTYYSDAFIAGVYDSLLKGTT